MNSISARLVLAVAALSLACAGQTPPPQGPAAAPVPDAARPTDPPAFAPLQAGPGPAPAAMGPNKVRLQIREAIFSAAWTAVRDKDFDKTLAGLDWQVVRAKYQPIALGGADGPEPARPPGSAEVIEVGTGTGDPGLVVRSIEGKPTVTSVRPDSSAARAGLRPAAALARLAAWALLHARQPA